MERKYMIEKVGYRTRNTYFEFLILLCMICVTSDTVLDFCWTQINPVYHEGDISPSVTDLYERLRRNACVDLIKGCSI